MQPEQEHLARAIEAALDSPMLRSKSAENLQTHSTSLEHGFSVLRLSQADQRLEGQPDYLQERARISESLSMLETA